jgi:catechol 2,3-dioxygenase-like lactoylglutathione lyase family enzyme
MVSDGLLEFEGIVAYGTKDAEEAEHFFEHTLGLQPMEDAGEVKFYPLSEETALAVDTTGAYAGAPPYLLFSSPDLEKARAHFLARGCEVIEMGADGVEGGGFFAHAPEGHIVCVVDQGTLEDQPT